jgi:hypothetical protein
MRQKIGRCLCLRNRRINCVQTQPRNNEAALRRRQPDDVRRLARSTKKALVTPLRGRFSVNVAGGADMDVQGNILAHEYKIEQGGRGIAEVSKKWFRIRDSYSVDIQPGQDDALILIYVLLPGTKRAFGVD